MRRRRRSQSPSPAPPWVGRAGLTIEAPGAEEVGVVAWPLLLRRRVAARVQRELPSATQVLPSAALGQQAGGRHLTDGADKEGTRTLEPVFLFDVLLESEVLQRLGQRAWVRFDLAPQPLAAQAYRGLRQLFLKHFSPSD